ncbi:MAG: hypothetical protein LBL31_03995 [Spirochaetaceae bacterium]|jgi:hypothetical protein|nr:hypothetical protein [Spirochaetaceae bacterium]
MKTKRFSHFGLPVVLLALGLVVSASLALAGCGDDDETPVAKSVTITGIGTDAFTGASSVFVWLMAELTDTSPVALRSGSISEGTLSVALTVPANGTYESNTRWTGSGSYYVGLIPIVNNQMSKEGAYVYIGDGGQTPAKVAFDDATATVTLDFAHFSSFGSGDE